MKKIKIQAILILFACLFFCFSCASNPQALPSGWHRASSFSDLQGLWGCDGFLYEYPFIVGGKKFLRYSLPPCEDTDLWTAYAQLHKIKFESLWEKRYVYASMVYENTDNGEILPRADVNGSQKGRKLFLRDGKVYSRLEYLVPEQILAINLSYFLFQKNGQAFIEWGEFNFASDSFEDFLSSPRLYSKIPKNTDE